MVTREGRQDLAAHDSARAQKGRPLSASASPMGTSSAVSILLIGINYAPELTGIGPYTTGLAEHFADQGHSVRVITGVPHYPQWRRGRAPSNGTSNPRVSRQWHYIPRRPSAFGRMLYEASWLMSGTRALVVRRPQVVIGVIPSLSGGVLAWLAGRKFRAPVGLIFQDLMGPAAAESGYRGGGRVAGLTRRTEAFIARKADGVATISDGFRAYLEMAGVPQCRIERVRNWARLASPTETRGETRDRLGWAPNDFVCLHAGNMGQKQGLDNLLEAAQLLRDPDVKIVLSGDGNDRNRLTERATALNLGNLSFIGLQSPGQFEAVLQAADVLLLQQRSSVSDMSLPSKLTAYFASGRPVVAAVAPTSSAAKEIRAAQAGIVINADEPSALAESLTALRGSRETARRLGLAGAEHAKCLLSREQALIGYDRFLENLLATKTQ
jgi:colanic acid biosynthesis glycosyl transferase WcaI